MFPQPMSELAIRADMAERQRESMSEADMVDSIRWFHPTKIVRPSWWRKLIWHLGHGLVFIGRELENSAIRLAPTPSQQLKSISQ